MIIRREDISGDFVFGHGLADYLTENEAIALLVKDRLLLWLAEWFLDISQGANWTMVLGKKPPPILLAEQEVRRIVLGTTDVTAVTKLSVTFDHTTFIVTMVCEISTIYTTGVLVQFQTTLQVGRQ
jgi:hypothetical protein